MITEDDFVRRRRPEWEELDLLLASHRSLHRLAPTSISRAASLYRALSTDLVRARTAGYSGETIAYLDALAARSHNALYGAPPYRFRALLDLVLRDFPRTLRRRKAFFGFAALLLVVPALVGFFGARASGAFAAEVLPESMIESMEEMYSKTPERSGGENVKMAGFYVNNNVGIAFRCFATGALFGLGSVFFLVYNGLLMGTVAGMLARTGQGMNLLTFCCGHSSFELTAIVISGAAGLRMGYALVSTGGRTRWGSLRACSDELMHLVSGAALMLLVAALIEGFWSPSAAPAPVKWIVSVIFAVAVTGYLTLAGRTAESSIVNWLASRVTLRIRSLSEIFDLGFIFLAENRKAYTKLALVTLVVPFGAAVALQFAHLPWWQVWSVAVVLGALVEGAFTTAAGQLLFTEAVETRRLLVLFGRRIVSYAASRIVCGLAMALGAPFIIPIPPIAARALFVSECSLLESASPAQCLRRGGQLMQGQTGPGAVFALLLLVVRFAFIVTAEELGQGLIEFVLQLGRPVGSLFEDGGSTFALAGFFASIPYIASTRFLGYVDRRTRREGWDIQVRFAALAQREGAEEAA